MNLRPRVFLLAFALGIASPASAAETFPTRHMTVVAPFPGGTPPDVVARILADGMQKYLRVAVPVENRPGADGAVGAAQGRTFAPDGYRSVLFTSNMVGKAVLLSYEGYHPSKDYTPVGRIGVFSPFTLVVDTKHNIKTFAEFAAFVRNHATRYAAPTPHSRMMARQVLDAARADALYVPYVGDVRAAQDLVGGTLHWMVLSGNIAAQLTQNGSIRILAAMSKTEDSLFPGIPLARDMSAEMEVFRPAAYLLVPRGVSRERISILSEALRKTLADAEVRERYRKMGFSAAYAGSEETAGAIAEELRVFEGLALKYRQHMPELRKD